MIELSSDTEDTSAAQAASRVIDAELLATSSPARLLDSPAHRQVQSNHFQPIERRPTAAKPPMVESPSARASDRPRHIDPAPVPNVARPRKEVSISRDATRKKVADARADEPSMSGPHSMADSGPEVRGKSLKLVGGAPRKMLLFQSQNSRPSSSETTTEGALRGAAKEPVRSEAVAEPDSEDTVFQRRIKERLARLEEKKKKKPALQRSSSDVTEQRPAVEKSTNGTGLRKTTSVVMSRLDSPDDPSLADFQFGDVTALDFDDPISDDAVAQPPVRPGKEPAEKSSRPSRATSSINARSFKPLVVKPTVAKPVVVKPPIAKPAPVLATRAAQAIAAEQKKNEDIGPWSKEAFDLMDWRPPNMQMKTAEST